MKKSIFYIGIVLMIAIFSSREVSAQGWKEIVPLVSTCEDVKRILAVKECEFPTSEYEFPKYTTTVYFKRDRDEWNVSKDTVIRALVIFKDVLRLRDYETDFKDYVIKREDDVPEITIYKNDRKGISLSVQMYNQPEPYIGDIFLYPSEGNAKKFKCKP
ncbi:MAG: hypothetical protein WKF34_07350 [Pyrinomonadaceae bacterium]